MHHRVFDIPELVSLSLPSDKKSLAALATTCSAFKEPALNALWADLDSILPLLLLLRPLEMVALNRASYWTFDGGLLTSDDWDVYKKYCFRVRALVFETRKLSLRGRTASDIDPSVFQAIALTRPSWLLLAPKLQNYQIKSFSDYHVYSLLFTSPTIQNLYLNLHVAKASDTRSILREIKLRIPGLEELKISSCITADDIEDRLVDCILGLESLKRITLPRCYFTPRSLDALSDLSQLESISTCLDLDVPIGTIAPSRMNIRRGTFRHLTSLSVATSLELLADVISEIDWAPELKALKIAAPGVRSLDSVHQFLVVLAHSRPQTTALALDLFNPSSNAGILSFRVILPLLSCREITSFSIRYRHPVVLDENKLSQIFRSWPRLTQLSLCPDIVKNDARPDSGVSWSLLHCFARGCPGIRHIGLPFNLQVPESKIGAHRLGSLESLHVGWSDVVDPFELAVFLAELCDRRLEIQVGDSSGVPSTNGNPLGDRVKARWTETKRLFQALARMRERIVAPKIDQLRALEGEVKMLRSSSSSASALECRGGEKLEWDKSM